MSDHAPTASTFLQSQFSAEFASFVNFIGAVDIDSAIARVRAKLSLLSPAVRDIYGDRCFFHEQWDAFTEGANAFRLDLEDLRAVRAATLIAAINKIKANLPQRASDRLRKTFIGLLRPDRDVRQIEHEIRAYAHFVRKRYFVRFADLEGIGRFDLLVHTPAGEMEVECKTVTSDTGSQVKSDMIVDLSETFRASVRGSTPVNTSGVFVLTFNKPTDKCIQVAQNLREALAEDWREGSPTQRSDFVLEFQPKPSWQALLDAQRHEEFRQRAVGDPLIASSAHCIVPVDGKALGLVLLPHKPTDMAHRMVKIFREAADQCTGERPAVLWLHLLGQAERDFIRLAQFSSDGSGAGLNAIVANALHPKSSTTDRSHVERIRFSVIPESLTRERLDGFAAHAGETVSVGGPSYDVPNPYFKFDVHPD